MDMAKITGPTVTICRRGGGTYEVNTTTLIQALHDFNKGKKGKIPVRGINQTKLVEITVTCIDIKRLPEWIRRNIIGEPIKPPLQRVLDLMEKQAKGMPEGRQPTNSSLDISAEGMEV